MKNTLKRFIALLSAGCMLMTASCSKKEESGVPADGNSTGEIEFVTNPDEPELGAYTTSTLGTKLYYEPEDVSAELMAALEKYFRTFAARDYEAYLECIHPEYIKEMNKYLEKDFGYDLETSFNSQCDNLAVNSGGEAGDVFTVTRIRAELPEEYNPQECLSMLDDCFGTESFYDTINESSDKLHHLVFFIMSETENSESETLIISEFQIVFAEKDGKYYTFG